MRTGRQRRAFPAGAECFAYKSGALAIDNVPIAEIAASAGTPFYIYSANQIRANYRNFAEAFAPMPALVAYAVKANSNQAILTLLAKEGAGADIVSGGELRRALAAGIAADKIVYSGVGKTAEELDFALQSKIRCFNVESIMELRLLSQRAAALGRIAPVSLRVNPDIDAETNAKIATGKAENKFGIPYGRALEAYALAASLPGIKICGADVHIGSQIEKPEPFAKAFAFAADLVRSLRAAGFPIKHIDIGGGLGIAYKAGRNQKLPPLTAHDYAELARQYLGNLDLRIITEPGRYITGNAGALIARIISVKQGEAKNFLIADAGMNDLIRPALYDAWHEIIPIEEAQLNAPKFKTDIVGPVCETGDYFALARQMPLLPQGALIAVLSGGAYGAVMAGNYNTRPLIAEVLADEGRFAIIRKRETYEQILARDIVPDWL